MTPEFTALQYAKEIGDGLHAKYPGHLWAISPSGDFSMLHVTNMSLSNRYGFNVPLRGPEALPLAAAKQKATQIGGEILERFNVSRGREGVAQAKAILHDRQGVREALRHD